MKQILIIALAFLLAGCSAIAPFTTQATPTAGATSTPQVVIQTVIVTVFVTAPATERPIPTATWTPIPTFTSQPTSLTATAGTPGTGTPLATATAGSGSATATLPTNAGGDLFSNLTRSGEHLSANCLPNDVTFGLSATNPSVFEVDLFYRLEYQNSSLTTHWVDVGKMASDNNGNFTFDFKASMIPSDLRTRAAWVDYQFIGLNRSLQVIGRSALILKQITFTPNCP